MKLLRALRAFSLPASVLPVILAAAAAAPLARWRVDVLAASVLGAAFLHLTGNLLNDYFDLLSGVDRRTEDDANRPGRLLVNGQLLPRDVLAEALCCLALAAGAASYLAWRCGPDVLWFLAAALIGLYAYTGPPFRLKYRALGEPLVFLTFGPALMAGAAWAQTGRVDARVLLLSVPVGLMTTAILVGGGLRDREEDAAAGIRTLAQFAGGRIARIAYLAAPVLAVAVLVAMGATGAGPRALVFTPLGLPMLWRPMTAALWRERLPDIDARTARFEMVMLLALIAIYVAEGMRS